MSDDGNDDSSCDVVSVVKCIVAPVGLASHGGVISFGGVNIAVFGLRLCDAARKVFVPP